MDDQKKNDSDFTKTRGTQIDLGDDLLESTVASPGLGTREIASPVARGIKTPENTTEVEDLLHSAKILIGEALNEEAKKVLRKILLHDPNHLPARKLLDQVQELEIKALLARDDQPKRKAAPSEITREVSRELVEEIIAKLDSDFKIGIPELSLFADPQKLREFSKSTELTLLHAAPQDRIDMGIAFLEMGLAELAAQQFKAALQNEDYFLAASALRAYALILAGKPFDAILEVQAILKDSEVKPEDRLEFLYLLGRAYEALREQPKARSSYLEAQKIDPHYRDLEERLRTRN